MMGRRVPLLGPSVLACLAVAGSAVSAQTGAELLTLERAIEIAVASNRPMQMSRLEEQRTGDDLAALRTKRRPVFDVKALEGGFLSPFQFSFREGAFGTYPSTGPIPFSDISIDSPRRLSTALMFTAVQPITQLRKVTQGEALLKLGGDVAATATARRRQALIADVSQVYYGLQQTRAGLVATGEVLTQLVELERVVAQYVEAEVALPRDLLSVRSERARLASEVLRLNNAQATLSERLNLLLGRDLATPFSVAEIQGAEASPGNVEAAVARARTSHPAIREAELNVQRASGNLRLKALDRVPDISLSFTYLRLVNVEVLPRTLAAAGVLVSWEPFDWGRRRYETDALGRTLEQANLGVQEARALVELDVRAKFRALLEAQEALTVTRLARETAVEDLRVITDRYRVEAALLKDVLASQTATAQATQAQQQALGAYWTARVELDRAVGGQP